MEYLANQPENSQERRKREKIEIITIAQELVKNREIFPFPGLDPDRYLKLKDGEVRFPGFAAPIDELIIRFKNEGIKVVLGDHSTSGNVFILPAGSDDVGNDSIFPEHLQVSGITDERLRKLVLILKSQG